MSDSDILGFFFLKNRHLTDTRIVSQRKATPRTFIQRTDEKTRFSFVKSYKGRYFTQGFLKYTQKTQIKVRLQILTSLDSLTPLTHRLSFTIDLKIINESLSYEHSPSHEY